VSVERNREGGTREKQRNTEKTDKNGDGNNVRPERQRNALNDIPWCGWWMVYM